jgi:ParB family transcriptional regulator, chromosome partitioning protein
MMKRISLMGRKRTRELGKDSVEVTELKKEQLLSMKLDTLNKDAKAAGTLVELAITQISTDKNQPRKSFSNIDLLANSVKQQGIIQPIIIKKDANKNSSFIIIAGERRFLAAKQAGLETVPCIVREEDDATILLIQLLENSQREQVAPLEEAYAIKKLIDNMKLSKSQIAKELGQPASWVSMRLGLLNASDKIKKLITDHKVEDFRTVHELRKLEEESPRAASDIINKINKNKLTGSYRTQISKIREQKKQESTIHTPSSPQIKNISYKNNELIIHQDKKKIKYYISKDDLKKLINNLNKQIS